MAAKLWRYGPAVLYAGLIFWLSHQPTLPRAPTSDKVLHVVAYFGLGLLLARALWLDRAWPRGRVLAVAAALATLYGVSDEWHQSFVPGRHPSAGDVLADALGSALGAGAWGALWPGLARFTSRVRRVTRGRWPPGSSPPSPP